MGKLFKAYLSCNRIWSCNTCAAHLADHEVIVSKVCDYLLNMAQRYGEKLFKRRVTVKVHASNGPVSELHIFWAGGSLPRLSLYKSIANIQVQSVLCSPLECSLHCCCMEYSNSKVGMDAPISLRMCKSQLS